MCRRDGVARAVLEAVAAGPLAWATVAQLASRAGIGPGELGTILARLVLDGWLQYWVDPRIEPERRFESAFTLTPIAASVLGLVLDEEGLDELPRWVEAVHDADGLLMFGPVAIHPADLVRNAAWRALGSPTAKQGSPPRCGYFDRFFPAIEPEA